MDLYSRLGSSLVFCFTILQVQQLGRTHLIVHIDVSGDYVVKTGIRQYTVSSNTYSRVVIKCSSRPPFASNLVLWKNNQPVTEGIRAYADGITFQHYYSWQRENSMVQKYHCTSSITKGISNDSYAHFTVWSEVEIRTESNTVLCASSVGRSGYVGEKATIRCMSTNRNYRCTLGGQYSWNITQQKFLVDTLSETTCDCRYWSHYYSYGYSHHSCDLHSISVVESVVLKIFNTNNVTNTDTSLVELVCTSNPPRLMFWAVFGVDGILFDFSTLNSTAFKVNTTVNITQSSGETTLRMSESVSGGNGIHTVICSTFDTEARIIALYRIQHQSTRKFDWDLSSPNPTEMQVTTVTTHDNPTSTAEGKRFVITTTEVLKDPKNYEMDGTLQGHEMKADYPNDYFLVVVVSVPLLSTNLILTVAVFYLCKKTRYNAEIKAQVSTQRTVSPDIELHDNPTYLAFTETEDTLCNEKEQMECTYANM